MKKLTGGGIQSRVVTRPSVRGGSPTTNKINPGAVSLLGPKQGNHAESGKVNVKAPKLVAGKAAQVPLGNAVALNVKGGRQTFRSGSQGKH